MFRIYNFHFRRLHASRERVGALLSTLGQSDNDLLWPWEHFDRMEFDGKLEVGTQCNHGPVRYVIVECITGQLVKFEFNAQTGPLKKFKGAHWFEVIPRGTDECEIRHMLLVDAGPLAALLWTLLIRTLHDATVEAALKKAEFAVTNPQPEKFDLTMGQKFWRWILRETGSYKGKHKAVWMR